MAAFAVAGEEPPEVPVSLPAPLRTLAFAVLPLPFPVSPVAALEPLSAAALNAGAAPAPLLPVVLPGALRTAKFAELVEPLAGPLPVVLPWLSAPALVAGPAPVPLSPVEPPVLRALAASELCGPPPPVALSAFNALALADGVALFALPLLPVGLDWLRTPALAVGPVPLPDDPVPLPVLSTPASAAAGAVPEPLLPVLLALLRTPASALGVLPEPGFDLWCCHLYSERPRLLPAGRCPSRYCR